MGQRRMFAKDIVRSDAFLDLPLSSQCLYFQLGMETDDRGYISNAKSIIRLVGANQGDLEMLIAKRFLLVRGETLLLQKHFKSNNIIRSDRFKETNYKEDLALLYYDENGNYTDHETEKKVYELPENVVGIPSGNQVVVASKDKLSKVKLSKDKIKLDKTRYKQKEFCEMLVNGNYLSSNEIQDLSYDNTLDDYVTIYGYVDTKIKLKYFIENAIFNEIDDKYLYFKTSMDKAFRNME